jgi:transcriptional regulator with XRE-family HTH domain
MQKELADYLGTVTSNYAQYELGTRTPPADKLQKLAKYFDCTTDYLLGITDKPDRMAPTELKEYGVEWISVVKSARAAGLSPAQMNELIETVKKLK